MLENELTFSPEKKEDVPLKIEIFDLENYSGMDIDDLKKESVDLILEKIGKNPKLKGYYQKNFSLNKDEPIESALETYSDSIVAEYLSQKELLSEKYRKQAEYCLRLALEKGYMEGVKDIKILLSNKFFDKTQVDKQRHLTVNSYDDRQDIICIEAGQPNRLLAHEIGHALSTNREKGIAGFSRIREKGEGLTIYWFNEGVTVLWEELSVDDASEIPQRNEKYDFRQWARETVKIIIREADIDEDVLMRAYFGGEDAKKVVGQKIQDRFRCTLEDLEPLCYSLDVEFTKKIISGEIVEIPIHKKTQKKIIESLKSLAVIFPNIYLVEK